MGRHKYLVVLIIVICISIFSGRVIFAELKREKEFENLKNIKSEYNMGNQEFVMIKSYDKTNLVRKTIVESKDFISEIEKSKDSKTELNKVDSYDYNHNQNKDDILLLAHLIESEAGSEPFIGKLAVANVVLNRQKYDNKSIEEVIYQENQFDGVLTDNFKKEPTEDSIKAAEQALAGVNIVPDAYFFANLNLCEPSFAKESTFISRIGDHWFFRRN